MGKSAESPFLHLPHLIRSINDPEHPLTLEELNVVEQVRVQVSQRSVREERLVRFSCALKGYRSLSSGAPQGIFGRGHCCAYFMDEETEAHRG